VTSWARRQRLDLAVRRAFYALFPTPASAGSVFGLHTAGAMLGYFLAWRPVTEMVGVLTDQEVDA
jgi:hypothetical protein